MTPEEVHRDLAAVGAALEDSRRQALDGALVDLAGLDERVGQICVVVTSLPADQARGFIAAIEGLLDALELVAEVLREQHEVLLGHDAHGARQRASAAYGAPATSPAGGGPADKTRGARGADEGR